jgi:hypothetical protein
MLKKRMLRRIFGSKRQKLIGSGRNSRRDKLHNLNTASYTVRVIRPRSMRLAGHVSRIISAGKPEGNI